MTCLINKPIPDVSEISIFFQLKIKFLRRIGVLRCEIQMLKNKLIGPGHVALHGGSLERLYTDRLLK